jgi:hypothetical protein
MSFGDVDAAAEIAKLSAQLTSVLIQVAELKTEVIAMRREFDRLYSSDHGIKTVQADRLPQWIVAVLLLAITIMILVYVGGRAGGI